MHADLLSLQKIATKPERLILGLMSGTSLDGLDLALCKIGGSDFNTRCDLLNWKTIPYPTDVQQRIKKVFPKKQVDLLDLTLLHTWIGKYHGQLVNQALQEWNIKSYEVDLIASHGQTIFHAPLSLHKQNEIGHATFQIGDADHLAVTTGIITLSDFRQKHIAGGGEGAPLAVYGDALLWGQSTSPIILLNIGGIANFTYLPGMGKTEDITVTDCGPGNTLMDAFVQKYFPGKHFDEDGNLAKQGKVNKDWFEALFKHPFFQLPVPKSTGQEIFNLDWVETTCGKPQTRQEKLDMLATLLALTVHGIASSLQTIPSHNISNIYVSGGGVHNTFLIQQLQNELKGTNIFSISELGMHPDAKEAMLFALLANQTIVGNDFPIKKFPTISLGKISFPT